MNVGGWEIAAALAAYVIAVIAVGVFASRGASKSAVEYFLAGRGLGSVVLFMALFGTNTRPARKYSTALLLAPREASTPTPITAIT